MIDRMKAKKRTSSTLKKPAHPEMRKVTMMLPTDLIRQAQAATKASLTETTRIALEDIARKEAYRRLLAMRGKVKFGMTWQELKALRD